MNALIVGTDKKPILDLLGSSPFLLIDDGPLIDKLSLPQRRKVVIFDIKRHHLNPLHKLDYLRAREFVAVIDAVFPEGADTLTKKNANFVLLETLLNDEKPRYLNTLIEEPDKKDAARQDAYQKIQTLMLSPVLSSVLCKPTNFSLSGIVLARLDRSMLGDFDSLIIGLMLMSSYRGQIILPDGFYLRDHHISLVREQRLIAAVNTLSELPERLRQAVLSIPTKIAAHALYEDAEVLARYRGLVPNTIEHSDFISEAMG